MMMMMILILIKWMRRTETRRKHEIRDYFSFFNNKKLKLLHPSIQLNENRYFIFLYDESDDK